MYADTKSNNDVRNVLKTAVGESLSFPSLRHLKKYLLTDISVAMAAENATPLSTVEGEEADRLSMLIVGMPNVGKSSLLNALRRVGVKRG
jgi:ribosome biogenesis GTPase A